VSQVWGHTDDPERLAALEEMSERIEAAQQAVTEPRSPGDALADVLRAVEEQLPDGFRIVNSYIDENGTVMIDWTYG